MSHVFISYSTHNASYASQLADRLRAEGFNVWIDNIKLRSSEDWWRSIVLAIDACAAFIVILSPESDQSRWVQREITLADQRNKPIFPLLLAGSIDTPNWALFVRTQYEDVRNGQLPGAAFYDQLAQHAPRKRGEGEDITDPRMRRPKLVGDPVLQAAMDDPPPPEGKATRRVTLPVALALLILVGLLGVGALVLNGKWPPWQPLAGSVSPEQHLLLGIQAMEGSEYENAIREFTLALDGGYEPRAEALTDRGDARRLNNDAIGALADYEAALADLPDYFPAHLGRAAAFETLGDNARALDAFTTVLDYAPNAEAESDVLEQMGRLYYYDGDYGQAIDHFSQALDRSRRPEQRSDAHYGLGLVYQTLGELESAIEHLTQATALNPAYSQPFRVLGEVYEANGNPEAALQVFRRYVELREGDVEPELQAHIRELEQIVSQE